MRSSAAGNGLLRECLRGAGLHQLGHPFRCGSYLRWRTEWEQRHRGATIYEVLRCGLVHEYKPKVQSAFYFSFGDALGLAEDNGTLVFIPLRNAAKSAAKRRDALPRGSLRDQASSRRKTEPTGRLELPTGGYTI